MARKKKKKSSFKDRVNNRRQKEYLRIGIVMLPDMQTERKAAMDLISSGRYKKEKEE